MFACLAITTASILLYLQPVFDLGFYYDDYPMLAALDDAPGHSWWDLYKSCRAVETAGRPGTCLYHSGVNLLLGNDPAGYHVLSIVFLALGTILLYAVLRRCGMGFWPALLACLLFVVYPGSNSTRLWPTGVGAQYILALYLGAVLLAIEALRRQGGRALALHLGSFALFALLVFTYEAVIVLIAIAVGLYLLSAPDNRRRALERGACDLMLAGTFTLYRLVIDPVAVGAGFTQSRTTGETIDRVWVVLGGAWDSWRPLFVPGTVGTVVVLVAIVICVVAMAKDRAVRRASRKWLLAGVAATVFAIASVMPYVVGNDLYVPDTASLFNRLNFAAAPAYCVLFVALCGLLWTALARWVPPAAATAVVLVLVVGVGVSQIDAGLVTQESWAASWDDQQAAVKQLRRLRPEPAADAAIMSFGHPIWESGFIPVFSASWDLRGAMDLWTRVDPSSALPFLDGATCGPAGVIFGGVPYTAYRGTFPLWFVNLKTGAARHIVSARQCDATVAAWGRPPFWGKTITGVP